ncbi:hypothetical protein [Mesorhizobium sp. M2A.F.Ca.ET.043.02.1.1]|uniref:hypothetical protein n=2 Tax=Mesorhizobium TaxID=68287 RepID=UPI000F75E919|nr:hypothetical protein [Mesorhizobium sp. M2A.F.Ca.ET.043.02.1.1]RWB42950.1 MAG: hypothetical protein EOQ46_18100 [Mesorhizobium sp.]AZO05081.1 hypothetical protein EJ068_19825 [Mesorhizobium sp. M2A.F.Ca.ET.043.02.1.1]RWB55521.1 MAG: hypothetical protein EOQ48_29955 [Mesorhizobium sp.]RWB88085.1 MAG: hypothetical protein EOQ51_08390 [Mesorhizobium sp.]RWC16680.1 MAG: hypothetical protein EOS52_04710 [Mesorhizobium sp.]
MMPSDNDTPDLPRPNQPDDVSAELVRLMPRDLVFVMRFMGESQHRLQGHFQDFIRAELAARGVTAETHPMIHLFIESHSILLRDFVFSGVSLSRQFRIDEIERLTGDTTSMIRVDIWDQLKSLIETAEKQFHTQADGLSGLLSAFEKPTEGQ